MLNGSFYFFLSVTLFLLDPISTISLSSEVNSCKLNSHADYFSFSREKERERVEMERREREREKREERRDSGLSSVGADKPKRETEFNKARQGVFVFPV